jgi:hypothetical protein
MAASSVPGQGWSRTTFGVNLRPLRPLGLINVSMMDPNRLAALPIPAEGVALEAERRGSYFLPAEAEDTAFKSDRSIIPGL